MTALRAVAAVVVATIATIGTAMAQDWPTRPIRILVGFGPGGGTDITARIVAQPLSEILGQPVVVENKPGAGGTTAADLVAKAPKDGYTALMMSNAHAISAVMFKTLPYDSVADFRPVSMVGTAGLMLVTHPDFPAKDVAGVIAAAKASPGKYNYGSPASAPRSTSRASSCASSAASTSSTSRIAPPRPPSRLCAARRSSSCSS